MTKKTDETTGFVSRDERLIRQLRCSHKWPVCLFDFTVTKSIHEFFVFKVQSGDKEHSDDGERDKSLAKVFATEKNHFEQDLRQFIISDEYVLEER